MLSGSGKLLGTGCDPGFERTDMAVRWTVVIGGTVVEMGREGGRDSDSSGPMVMECVEWQVLGELRRGQSHSLAMTQVSQQGLLIALEHTRQR